MKLPAITQAERPFAPLTWKASQECWSYRSPVHFRSKHDISHCRWVEVEATVLYLGPGSRSRGRTHRPETWASIRVRLSDWCIRSSISLGHAGCDTSIKLSL